MTLRVRQAGFADLRAAAAMKAAAWRESYAAHFPPELFDLQDSRVDRTAAYWERHLGRGGYVWIVVDSETGEVVGEATAEATP